MYESHPGHPWISNPCVFIPAFPNPCVLYPCIFIPCVLIPSNANPCVFQTLHFVKSWISLTQKFKITILFSPISFDHTSHYSFWAVIILCTLQRVSQSTAKNTAVPLCCTAAQSHTAAYSSSASIEKLFKSIYFSSKVTLNFKVKLMANSV